MDEKEIRSFLVQSPRGAKILVRTEDEEVHEIAPPGGKGGATWAHLARSIDAMPHTYIEIHDSEGRLIRATRTTAEKAEAAPAASVGPVMHSDPETARLTHFANLLSEAWKFSTGLAFEKMVALSQMSVDRMMAIETRLERTEANYRREMKERLDEAFERAEELAEEAEEASKGQPTDLLQTFAAGMANGRRDAATQTPPNGKKPQ